MLVSWDEDIVLRRNKLGAVSAYLQAKGLHGELMQQIVKYFSSNERSANIPMSKILPSLNLGLQHEVASFITGDCLQQTALFRGCTGPMLDNLQLLLRDVDFLDGEYIHQQGNVAYEMFIVIRGSVSIITTDEMGHHDVEQELGIGDSIGDLEFFFQMRHVTSCRALDRGARCLRLGRDSLMAVLKMHQDDERAISSSAADLVATAKQRFPGQNATPQSIHSLGSRGTRSHCTKRSGLKSLGHAESGHADEVVSASLEINSASADSESDQDIEHQLMDTEITQAVFSLSVRRQKEQLFTHLTQVARGELDKVQQGIREGIAIDAADANGRTALHVAASSGHRQIVGYLLDAKAQTRTVDAQKNTPLADAVRSKHDAVAQLLREHDRDLELDLPDDGGNAVQLINAAFNLDLEQIRRLVRFGVSVNDRDYDGRTALHIAASEGWVEVVDYLLKADADVNVIDRFGGSPLTDAVRERAKKAPITQQQGLSLTKTAHFAHDYDKVLPCIVKLTTLLPLYLFFTSPSPDRQHVLTSLVCAQLSRFNSF